MLASIPEIQWEQYKTLNESEGYNTRKKKMTPSDTDATMSIKEANTFSDITFSRATKIKASNTLSVGARNKLKGQAWSEEEQVRQATPIPKCHMTCHVMHVIGSS